MNILQTEDLIKGMPDQRLMQEAQNPTGQAPQFLVISEIQRRGDMRKRFKAQEEQPQGTVKDRILQGGIGSIPQQQRQPPPNQPFPLPQGPGIAPNPNQFPPPPRPNAELAPRGMAGGGVVRMAGGGGTNSFTMPMGADIYTVNMAGYPSQEAAIDAMGNGMNPPLNVEPRTNVQGLDEPTDFTVNPVEMATDAVNAAGIASLSEAPKPSGRSGSPYTYEQEQAFKDSIKDAITTGYGFKDLSRDIYQPWFEAWENRPKADNMYTQAADERSAAMDRGEVLTLGQIAKNVAGDGLDAGGISNWNSSLPERSVDIAPVDTPVTDPADEGIIAAAAAESPELYEAVRIKNTVDSEKTEQMAAAEGEIKQGSFDYDAMMAQQRKSAYSNALIQIGAGIAGGDTAGGISKAGMAMAQAQDSANVLALQKIRNDAMDARLDKSLAQRTEEMKLRGDAGSADIRTGQWFMDLSPESQRLYMRYKGRDMPEDVVRKLVAETVAKREADGMNPMTQADQDSLADRLRGLYDLPVKGGGTPVIAAGDKGAYDALAIGAIYLDEKGKKWTKGNK